MAGQKFDVHPSVAMVKKWADELPAKTGRSLDQWAEVVKRAKLAGHKEQIALLRNEYHLGNNEAWVIVGYANDSRTWDGDPAVYLRQAPKYVEAMFAGAKASLRPIFDRLYTEARKLGKDVKVCPCKTMVPFYRKRVFAEVMPATKTRVELSLVLVDVPFKGILKKNPRAKGNDRRTHQIHLAAVADVTPEVLKWLKAAYDGDESE